MGIAIGTIVTTIGTIGSLGNFEAVATATGTAIGIALGTTKPEEP